MNKLRFTPQRNTSKIPPPSIHHAAPLVLQLLSLAPGESFPGNWRAKNGVYATGARIKREGLVPRDWQITIQPDTAGEGRWRVWRMK